MEHAQWHIGELARATGLTVRTLRHYEHEGLLVPSGRSAAGHRLYDEPEVRRLYEILVLRRLGLRLAEIREQLAHPRDLRDLIRDHIAAVRDEIEERRRLVGRLQRIASSIEVSAQPSSEALLEIMERMTMLERYLSAEQMATLREHRRAMGEQRIREASQEREQLLSELRVARESGIDPAAPPVREVAERLRALFVEWIGGTQLAGALTKMVEVEGPAAASHGLMTDELVAYMQRALAE